MRTGVGRGAQFTGVSPGSSQRAAAGGSGHAHADLSAAGDSSVSAGEHVQEAVPNAGVLWRRGRGGDALSHCAGAFLSLQTVMRFSSRRWLTYAAHSSWVELKVGGAVAQVAARSVGTQPIDAVDRVGALVDVCGWRRHT